MSEYLEVAGEFIQHPVVSRVLSAVVLVILVWIAVRMVRRAVTRNIEDVHLRYNAGKMVRAAGWVIVVIALAGIFSDKLGGLALSLGVAGAGVAFALQEVIASAGGRLAIAFGGFYKTGDRVQLGGIKGDVIDIGLLRTTIMEVGDWVKGDLFTGRVVRVANSFIFKEPVFNYSGDFGFLWDEIRVPISYGCDHLLAKKTLQGIAHEVTQGFADEARGDWERMLTKFHVERAKVDSMVTLEANDNWMEFTVRYVVPFTKRRITKDQLFERVLDAVNGSGGKLSLASATFHLVAAPTLEVRLTDGKSAAGP